MSPNSDRTECYAGTASVIANSFAGEIALGDFARFELRATVTNQAEADWPSKLRTDLQAVLESITPVSQ